MHTQMGCNISFLQSRNIHAHPVYRHTNWSNRNDLLYILRKMPIFVYIRIYIYNIYIIYIYHYIPVPKVTWHLSTQFLQANPGTSRKRGGKATRDKLSGLTINNLGVIFRPEMNAVSSRCSYARLMGTHVYTWLHACLNAHIRPKKTRSIPATMLSCYKWVETMRRLVPIKHRYRTQISCIWT